MSLALRCRVRWLAAWAFTFSILFSTRVRADETAPQAPTQVFYGEQVLLADAAVLVGGEIATRVDDSHAGAAAKDFGAVTVLAIGAQAFAAPAVHLANGNYTRIVPSLLLRVPYLALSLVAPPGPYTGELAGLGATIRLFGPIGLLALGSAIDAAALSWKPAPTPRAGFSVSPTSDGSGAGLSASGVF